MKRTNNFQIIRLSLLLLGVMVFWVLSSAFFVSQAQAIGNEQDTAPVNVLPQQIPNSVNPRPQAASWSFDLCASDGTIILPDSSSVTVWGFVDTGGGSCTTGLANSLPGPELRVTAGDTVTINLTNALAENVSILIVGQNMSTSGGVAGLFTAEAAASGGTVSYNFTAQEGTYLYESGTNPSIQIPMGLYGALIVDSATSGQAYGQVFDQEAVLLLSEIDPALNANPAGFNLLDYHPTYWLINGEAYPGTDSINADPGDRVLLRYLNAGFDHPSMMLLGGYQTVIAKDGYPLANAFDAVAETIPAGTSADMIVDTTGLEGSLPLYNRNMYVTNGNAYPGGMLTFLDLQPAVGNPPTISIVNPSNGDTVAGNAVSIQIDANDAEDTAVMLTVEWNVGGGPWQSAAWVGPYYEASWDSTGVGDGAYTLFARVTDTDANTTGANIAITVDNIDEPPIVNAGLNQTIALPDSASLDGTVTDDGFSPITTLWDMVSGPGTVTFGDDSLVDTTASFSVDGVYVLSLTATDGTGPVSDEVTITVNPQPIDQPPTVDAGMDQSVTLPSSAALDGTVNDDGLSALTTLWTATSGPGTVTFGDDSLVDTTASFSVDGDYVLRLTATDGTGSVFDEVTVTVNPAPALTMHIGSMSGSVTGSSGGGGGGTYTVTMIITVHDASHNPLVGVTVSGLWTTGGGGFDGTNNSCVTNASGQCPVVASHNLNPNNANNYLTFTVNNLTLATYTYASANNDVPNSFTVLRPP